MNRIALTEIVNKADPFHVVGINTGLLALEAYASQNCSKEVILVNDLDDIFKVKPDMVCLSSITESYGHAIEAAKSIKSKLKIPVVIGGAHITSLPESLDPIFDAAVIGEGEETFLELINSFPNIEKIKGLAYWKNNKLVINDIRPPIANLDTLPIPRREKWIEKIGMAYMITTRGCPYKCSFCSSPVIWGGCRSFSSERVVLETKEIIEKFKQNYFIFLDDIFILNKERLRAIVERLRDDGITKDVVFSCFGRVNLIDEEIIALLKTGNVQYLFFGMEFTSNSLLAKYKDQNPTIQEGQKIIDLLYNNGIRVRTSFIIGTPDETEKNLASTCDFIEKNKKKLFEIEINPLIAYPGTEIWKYVMKNKLIKGKIDWSRLKESSCIPMFDPDKYIYLNKKVPYKTFLDYVKKFQALYREISLAPQHLEEVKKYYKPGDFPARFKPMV